MVVGLPALEQTNWSELQHAFGRAIDTPRHLRALLGDDRDAIRRAVNHLLGVVMHDGTPWTATAPAALVVVGLLEDPRIDAGPPLLREELLTFLVQVAHGAQIENWTRQELHRLAAQNIDDVLNSDDPAALLDDQDALESLFARSILDCIRVSPALYQAMLANLDHPRLTVRMIAADGAAAVMNGADIPQDPPELSAQLHERAQRVESTDERSALVLSLGELGSNFAEAYLEDPSPAVRMCARLAPHLDRDDAVTASLMTMLETQADQIDSWFTEKPPQFHIAPRFFVVARVLAKVKDFNRLVSAALALLPLSTPESVDYDWGPFLIATFQKGDGKLRTAAQLRFFEALLEQTLLWEPPFPGAAKWFKKAGVPYDRRKCRKMAEGFAKKLDKEEPRPQ